MLRSEPSFCIYHDENENNSKVDGDDLPKTVFSGDFSFGNKNTEQEGKNDGTRNGTGIFMIEEGEEEAEIRESPSPPMYLAAGLGIDCNFIDGGDGLSFLGFNGGDVEEFYRRMADAYPCHPVVLSNYAHLLQSKGDLHGAEDYYHRATLVDPDNGQNLCQYAKLIWELHRDKDRAFSVFERAAHAALQDCDVIAAYASFLWEADYDDDVEDKLIEEHVQMVCAMHQETNGDPQGAMDYHAQALRTDPADGETLSQYAKLIWERHQDQNKATSYFEKSIQASPEDSHVLAAYASFLWETTDENEE